MNDKKVLTILLGSPRAQGNSEQLADSLAKGAEEAGYEVRKVRLAPLTLKGCVDCRKCWSTGAPCVQNDDMGKVYPDMEAADVLAFVSPVYFYSWSSQIKPVWDRMLPYFMQDGPKTFRGKKAVLLSVAGDNDDSCFEGIKSSFKGCCNYADWSIAGIICAPAMYPKTDMADKGRKFLFEAYDLGKNL